jgi:hypothetical protein
MAESTWIADRRLYLDKDGKVVESDDPTRATLLVPAGGSIPRARARSLGLIVEEQAPPPEIVAPSEKTPKPNKAKTPGENKGE